MAPGLPTVPGLAVRRAADTRLALDMRRPDQMEAIQLVGSGSSDVTSDTPGSPVNSCDDRIAIDMVRPGQREVGVEALAGSTSLQGAATRREGDASTTIDNAEDLIAQGVGRRIADHACPGRPTDGQPVVRDRWQVGQHPPTPRSGESHPVRTHATLAAVRDRPGLIRFNTERTSGGDIVGWGFLGFLYAAAYAGAAFVVVAIILIVINKRR
ncbi:MAG TPA: hypothetical protein VFE65_06605 [Pseudonocardia sp.]|jgi:hypothetical protein|nr:hypothetical protein [Pseudonocardia sp.]